MAKRDEQQRKLELQQRMSQQRRLITSHRHAVSDKITETKEHYQQKLNVPKRILAGVKNNPKKWFIVSAVGGLLASKLIFRKKASILTLAKSAVSSSKSGSVKSSLMTAVTTYALKPLFKSIVLNKLRDFATKKYLMQQQQQAYEADQAYEYEGTQR